MPRNGGPGRRERQEARLRAAVEAGDVMARTELQHLRANRLMADAEGVARKERLRRWRLGEELSRPPLVPDYAPIDAVLTELPQFRDAYPHHGHCPQPGYDSRIHDNQIRRERGHSPGRASGILLQSARSVRHKTEDTHDREYQRRAREVVEASEARMSSTWERARHQESPCVGDLNVVGRGDEK